jgi:hypothetical protein
MLTFIDPSYAQEKQDTFGFLNDFLDLIQEDDFGNAVLGKYFRME